MERERGGGIEGKTIERIRERKKMNKERVEKREIERDRPEW